MCCADCPCDGTATLYGYVAAVVAAGLVVLLITSKNSWSRRGSRSLTPDVAEAPVAEVTTPPRTALGDEPSSAIERYSTTSHGAEAVVGAITHWYAHGLIDAQLRATLLATVGLRLRSTPTSTSSSSPAASAAQWGGGGLALLFALLSIIITLFEVPAPIERPSNTTPDERSLWR